VIIFWVFFGIFLCLLVFWVANTYWFGKAFSRSFHKASSLILLLKVLCLASSIWYWSCCPYEDHSVELLKMLRIQSLSFFQAFLLGYFLFLSQGAYLLSESAIKPFLSYNLLLIIISYIFCCASNTLGSYIKFAALGVKFIILAQIIYFHLTIYWQLIDQRNYAIDINSLSLRKTVMLKVKMFFIVTIAMILYFAGYIIINFVFISFPAKEIDEITKKEFHQILGYEINELVVLLLLFVVLRAKKIPPLFFTKIEHFGNPLPFYSASKNCVHSELAVILFPRRIAIGKC
jgi:hypothetical protein